MKIGFEHWAWIGLVVVSLGCGDGDGGQDSNTMSVFGTPVGPVPDMPSVAGGSGPPVNTTPPGPPPTPSPGPVAPTPAPTGPSAMVDAGMPAPSTGADAGDEVDGDPGACDRTCLLAIMQGYIDALIANDPSTLTVSADLKYTENGVLSELGETVWQSASELVPDTRLDFADPLEGQVASQFVFNENGSTPVIYQVRLKVVTGEITEIEAMAVRQRGAANGFFNVQNMKPEAAFLAPVDPATRHSREELLEITNQYLDYLEGKRTGSDVPFDTNCKRYENGVSTASGVAAFNAQSFWRFEVTRRILVVDEEAAITWGMFPFSQSDQALVVGEAFKIVGGKIMMIQAVMANQPAKIWD